MRKFLVFCLAAALAGLTWVTPVEAVEANKIELTLDAEAVVLMDAATGTVLYQKNGFQKEYPASITKIMTVYLAVTRGSLDQVLTASKTAIDDFDRTSTHIWLDYDEQLTLEDACYATLLQSANDTANVLAEAIGGTQENFASMMSAAALEAGALGTNFTNAHGLPDENHYTTAYDMAMITRQALTSEAFRTIFESIRYTMNPTNKQSDSRTFATGNELIKNSKNYYEYARGGKIGWTEPAGYTLVATAEKDGMELIAVVLNSSSRDANYADARALFEYGFEYYKTAVASASQQEPQTYQITKGSKVLADCTFTMENDFKILLDADEIADLIKVEFEMRNTSDPETIECYAILTMSGNRLAEQKMKADITVYDLSFKAVYLPKIRKVFDFLCALMCVFFVGIFILAGTTRILKKS